MPQPTTTGGGIMSYPSTVDTGVVAPLLINNETALAGDTITVTIGANTVRLFAFELLAPAIITKTGWYMGATATGTTNMGIYTFAGNLVSGSDTGAVTNVASSDNGFTYVTPVSLSPGQYFIAVACSNGTDTYYARSFSAGTTESRARIATNVLSAGALPSTTGAISTGSVSVVCALKVSGGLA